MKGFGRKASSKAPKASAGKGGTSNAASEKKKKTNGNADPENANGSEMSRTTSTDSGSAFSKTLSSLANIFSVEVGLPGDKGVDVAHPLPTKEEAEARKRKRILIALIILFLAVVIFLIVFFLTRDDSKSRSIEDTQDRVGILEGILDPDVTPRDVLRDNTTAQHEAMMWFAYNDPTYPDLSELSDDLIIARYVAALLYISANGPDWRRQLNFMADVPVCEWNDGGDGEVEEGIVCDSDDAGRIDGIVVDLNRLGGTLPSELSALPYLKHLGLASNDFTGTIPTEFGLMTSLVVLSLSGNALTGSLPSEMANMRSLEVLRVQTNKLQGRVPTVYNKLTSLKTIHLEGNNLSGNLEVSLCGLKKEFNAFIADCRSTEATDTTEEVLAEINCFCCTHCCFNGGGCLVNQSGEN